MHYGYYDFLRVRLISTFAFEVFVLDRCIILILLAYTVVWSLVLTSCSVFLAPFFLVILSFSPNSAFDIGLQRFESFADFSESSSCWPFISRLCSNWTLLS